jgi:peptide/nickel transport system ATP-binding protein
MSSGRIVERGPTKQVLQHPKDDYTKRLLAAIPAPFAEDGRRSGPARAETLAAREPINAQTTKGVS